MFIFLARRRLREACLIASIIILVGVVYNIRAELTSELVRGFKYVKNPGESVCLPAAATNSSSSPPTIDLLIYVHSTPSNMKNRVIIRETWAKRALFPQTRLVFMLGSTHDQELARRIDLENDLYNDIVQQDFLDSYRNLTLKSIMALDWVVKHCPNAKYVLKTDDDVIVIIKLTAFVTFVVVVLLCIIFFLSF